MEAYKIITELLDKIEEVSSTGDDYHIDIEDIENLQKAQEQIKLLNLDFVMQRSELLLFADYSESDKTSETTDECVDNYLAQKQ